ncbi:hypothetical protein PAN31117_02849 [Pandoraea anapnoica]|uniref:Uncharacterized protein n=1 Tax=Pandoraea anapnoica TaxID=2508301 RepID=A0A5E5A4Q8_9BURK|nr:hypothetical protein [Pandoraea anapnoica]VVE68118.1 hypothetical protein PAN31117_02849 [Pandoraea anapnoica]
MSVGAGFRYHIAAQQGWLDRLLAKLGASDKVDVSRGMDWGVMPGPFYNPEMEVGIGAAAVGLYKTHDALPTTQLSTLAIHGFGTTTGAFGIGVDAHFDSTVNRDKGDASAFVTDPIGPYVRSIGLSTNFSYDTRDFIPNPYKGQALSLTAAVYRRAFDGSTSFESFEWACDHYTTFRQRDVLAFDVYGKFGWGEVQWSMMPTFGDGNHMRAYFQINEAF